MPYLYQILLSSTLIGVPIVFSYRCRCNLPAESDTEGHLPGPLDQVISFIFKDKLQSHVTAAALSHLSVLDSLVLHVYHIQHTKTGILKIHTHSHTHTHTHSLSHRSYRTT